MREHPDHPFIKKAREICDIPEDAEFLDAFLSKWAVQSPEERKRDLFNLEREQKYDCDLRQETQLASVRRRLRDVDQRLRKAGM